jgi:hypothetical protein
VAPLQVVRKLLLQTERAVADGANVRLLARVDLGVLV